MTRETISTKHYDDEGDESQQGIMNDEGDESQQGIRMTRETNLNKAL